MPDRKNLFTLCLGTALVLLASVVVAPIRTWGGVIVSSRPDCLRRNFSLPPTQPTTRLCASTDTDGAVQGNAITSEDEEQDRAEALDEPRVSFLIPGSFRKVPDRQSIVPRPIPSLYPLRC